MNKDYANKDALKQQSNKAAPDASKSASINPQDKSKQSVPPAQGQNPASKTR